MCVAGARQWHGTRPLRNWPRSATSPHITSPQITSHTYIYKHIDTYAYIYTYIIYPVYIHAYTCIYIFYIVESVPCKQTRLATMRHLYMPMLWAAILPSMCGMNVPSISSNLRDPFLQHLFRPLSIGSFIRVCPFFSNEQLVARRHLQRKDENLNSYPWALSSEFCLF